MVLPSLMLAVLDRQRAFITRAQAMDTGCTRRELDRWIAQGVFRNLWRGILTIAPEPATVGERNLELARALALTYDARVLISHESALLAHGLPTYAMDLRRARLVRTNLGDVVSTQVLRIGRSHREFPSKLIDGAPVVVEAIAIAQVACDLGVEAAVVAADAALHRRSVTKAELADAVEALRPCRGLARATRAIDLADARSESPGEALTRLIARTAAIPLEPQVKITNARGEFVARVDFQVAGTNRVVEFDGKTKYEKADDLFAEKKREDRLRELDYEVVRVVWADLASPAKLIERIRPAG